jgi:hypothetical protein
MYSWPVISHKYTSVLHVHEYACMDVCMKPGRQLGAGMYVLVAFGQP